MSTTNEPKTAKQPGSANTLRMVVFTILLGAFAGAVVWCFLKAVSACTGLFWGTIPERTGTKLLLLPICAAGGALAGLLHKRFGNYPEELNVVMEKVKRDRYYPYHPMFIMLLCAFLPLVLGASVGPEAGLTGIIAGLCYWVGDNVTFAKQNAAWFSELGEAVTLGQLFHAPLFGILAVEEEPQTADEASGEGKISDAVRPLTKPMKLLFYGISTAAGFLTAHILSGLFGEAMEGFPSFPEVSIGTADYALLLLYIPVGLLLCVAFEKAEQLSEKAAGLVPDIARETICGILIAVMSLFLPIVLFSGEEQMADLMKEYGEYSAVFLIVVCIVKLILTAFCIRFGLKGGHFFPVIFACACMGYGIAMLIFAEPAQHLVFAAAVVAASMLGAQMKKPLAVSVLLLICFPARILFWIFFSALISGQISAAFLRRKSSRRMPEGD